MIGAIAIGLLGGVVAGMLGVGGGVVFVPGLVIFLGLGQHQAEATSLLAIIPVAIVGTYTQDRYGNVCRGDALALGLLSVAGAAAGACCTCCGCCPAVSAGGSGCDSPVTDCLNSRMPLPSERPISGSRLAPNTNSRITTRKAI